MRCWKLVVERQSDSGGDLAPGGNCIPGRAPVTSAGVTNVPLGPRPGPCPGTPL